MQCCPIQQGSPKVELDYTPIGVSGEARKLFTERRYAEAASVLRDAVAGGQVPPSVVAFYGRAAAEAQDDEAFRWWFARTDETTRQYAEYWSAVGTYLQVSESSRQLLEHSWNL